MSSPSSARWIVPTFFGLLLLLGVVLHRDYGVSVDEPNNHLNGLVNIKFLASLVLPERARAEPGYQQIPALSQFKDADHGPAFEILAAVFGYVFARNDSRSFYFLRHLLLFCVFVGGAWALYGLAKARYGSWRWGLAAAAALVLSPRLFAEAFYNGKDVVFLALFTLAAYSLLRLLQRPTRARALLHGLATALAVDVRIQGLLLVALTLLLLAVTVRGTAAPSGHGRVIGWYVGSVAILVPLGWPYLWATPWPDLLHALSHLHRFPWPYTTLYLGRLLPATQLPWHYIPVWLFVTTPLPYTVAALLGMGISGAALLRGKHARFSALAPRLDLLFLLWLLVPLVTVAVVRPVLYDGWRHLYFVYPALLLLAVQGLRALWHAAQRPWMGRWLAFFLLGVAGAETLRTVYRQVALHPYENVYFSFLPARAAERLFERDYWGLSYRQGLEWLLRHDASPQLSVNSFRPYAFYSNSLLLPPAERARLQYVPERARARYFITTYRWHPQSYRDSVGQEIYAIRADGLTVLAIFKQP